MQPAKAKGVLELAEPLFDHVFGSVEIMCFLGIGNIIADLLDPSQPAV
jgi:hypothetical protein